MAIDFGVVLLQLPTILFIPISPVSAQLSTDPLNIAFDHNDGRRAFISWNPLSRFRPEDVTEIMQRRTGHVIDANNPGSIKDQYGMWARFAKGPLAYSFSQEFSKTSFCDTYEFCITDKNSGATSQATSSSPCSHVQPLGVPTPERTVGGLTVQQKYYSDGDKQIHVKVSPNLSFKYWTNSGAVLGNPNYNITVISCRDGKRSNDFLQPSVFNAGTEILFSPEYAKSDCRIRYELQGQLSIPNESCISSIGGLDYSVDISLNCFDITSYTGCLPVVTQSPPIVIAGNPVPGSPPFQRPTTTCYDCRPTVRSQAIVDWDRLQRRSQKRVQLWWSFPAVNAGRTLREYRVRYSKSDFTGNSVINERDIEVSTYPYSTSQLKLPYYDGGNLYGFANPIYLVQVCAIYDNVCSVDWNSQDRYPVVLRAFEDTWSKLLTNSPGLRDANPITVVYPVSQKSSSQQRIPYAMNILITLCISLLIAWA